MKLTTSSSSAIGWDYLKKVRSTNIVLAIIMVQKKA
jgi:hypothetical protein